MTDIPVISFLSDYGLHDEFVGVCHGVIARRCPSARIIDITHAIPRHDIALGALTLASAIGYLPTGVHMAVVDPGVGSVAEHARRAVALRAADRQLLVGPDNGLLTAACEQLGGAIEAVDIGRSPERLEPVSATFHGRDIFAPVAGALAAGALLDEVGEPLDIGDLKELSLPRAEITPQGLRTHVLHCDHFGNVILDTTHEQLAQIGLRIGQRLELQTDAGTHQARYARTFADVADGELLLYEDAQRMAALAVNRGSAGELLELTRGMSLLLLSR